MTPEEIRALRIGLGLTQVQFGDLLGVHHMTVYKWEQPKHPSRPNAHQVAMMRSFERARSRQPTVGQVAAGLLVGAGVAAAIYVLLRAAFDADE